LPRQRFNGFVKSDFSVFSEEKRKDPKFNEERKSVWEKIRTIQSYLDRELGQMGFGLEGKVSQYWINSVKPHVNGIWLAYTDVKPYYLSCQLNCGIYSEGFFAGIEINSKARDDLSRVAEFIEHNPDEFLGYVRRLDPQYLMIDYGDWMPEPDQISTSDLDALRDAIHNEIHWFSLGEYYRKTEDFLADPDFLAGITDIFELLFPLYLVFLGRRPLGRMKTDKLLRIGDAKQKEIARKEMELATDVTQLSERELNELIAIIDQRNKSESTCMLRRENEVYRRNPALSSMLKQKRKDKCQICSTTFKVESGFFCDTHHLLPLRAGGLDVSDNILVLCPNHHRIFERARGNVRVISRNKLKITVRAGCSSFDVYI